VRGMNGRKMRLSEGREGEKGTGKMHIVNESVMSSSIHWDNSNIPNGGSEISQEHSEYGAYVPCCSLVEL
jgi:hypothetical protein